MMELTAKIYRVALGLAEQTKRFLLSVMAPKLQLWKSSDRSKCGLHADLKQYREYHGY